MLLASILYDLHPDWLNHQDDRGWTAPASICHADHVLVAGATVVMLYRTNCSLRTPARVKCRAGQIFWLKLEKTVVVSLRQQLY